MKKIHNVMILLAALILTNGSLFAQEEILIKKTDWGDYTNITYSILSDSITSIIAAHPDKDVQFVLERNSVYFVAAEINNPDFHLRIKAEEGTGSLPLIMLKLNDATGDWPDMFSTQQDVTFENLHITYEHGDKFSQYGHKINNFGGEGSSIKFIGCYLERERQAPIRLAAADMKVLIEDCRIGNVGERTSIDGNGRAFDTRGNNADTVIIRNTSIYNVSDRVFRTDGAHINYLELDHITSVNNLGRHACISLASVNKAVITNWLFMDPCMLGSGRTALVEEQYAFEGSEYRYFISLDTQNDDNTTELEISNNNFANTQTIKDIWASIDSLEAPLKMNPLIEGIMGDASAAAFLDPEVVEFTKINDFPYTIIDSVYKYYTPDDMNNKYGIYSHDTSVFIQNLDLSYSKTSVSYTAGVDGYPLGDLNSFPALKSRWEQGLPAVSVEDEKAAFDMDNMLSIYPNPFSTESNINYALSANEQVMVAVYSVNGQLVKTLVSQEQAEGSYSVKWNGTNNGGQMVSSGTYLVVIKAGESVDANYVVFTE
jgi:hypothetical protein